MSTQSPKQVLFGQFAVIAKTLGHAHRLELLEQLGQGERSVEILAQKARLSVANASQHLQHLRRAGLVTPRRGYRNSIRHKKSWPTVADPTACCPTRP